MIRLHIIHLDHESPGTPPHRKQRYDTLMKELKTQGIENYWIWAGVEDKFPHTGISRAFKRIVKYAKDNNLEMVAIAEDDIRFSHRDSWKYFLENVPSYFDLYLSSFYSGLITFDNRIEDFRGMTLLIVHSKFYDKFLDANEETNIDHALVGLGEYFVCPMWPCTQHPGFSENLQMEVNHDIRIDQSKLFKGYQT